MKNHFLGIVFVISFISAVSAQAQDLTNLFSFHRDFSSGNDWGPGSTGVTPRSGVTIVGSTIFGTTQGGGLVNGGTIFRMGIDGNNYSVLHSFSQSGSDYADPDGTLSVYNSCLYGVTSGGFYNSGALFKINQDGTGYNILHVFDGGIDGFTANGDLVQIGSNFYGICIKGGTNNAGMVYRFNANNGAFTPLYSFGGSNSYGPEGGLTVVGSQLYGTTFHGGKNGLGNIFKLNLDGTGYTDLYDFADNSDGEQPFGRMATDGTYLYGFNSYNTSGRGCGVLFRIGINGSGFTVLRNNGNHPAGSPTLVGSVLYCAGGGDSPSGDIFQINTDGTGYKELHVFSNDMTNVDWGDPSADLAILGSTLYGTAELGGTDNRGRVFALTIPEPSTIALLLTATIGGLLLWYRRR